MLLFKVIINKENEYNIVCPDDEKAILVAMEKYTKDIFLTKKEYTIDNTIKEINLSIIGDSNDIIYDTQDYIVQDIIFRTKWIDE